jgi:catechol 2,3-dioxygenase-like lactoylglutathione lyase family enzyme
MIKSFDHINFVVVDMEEAKSFFALFGFREAQSEILSGQKFVAYLGIEEIRAESTILVLDGASPRQEIRLLKYLHPQPLPDPNINRLDKIGYNHPCFAVDDIELEVKRLKQKGVNFLTEITEFSKERKLALLEGPQGITLELVEKIR